jgi:aminopeptidase N
VQKTDENDEVVAAFRFPVEIEIVTNETGAVIESEQRESFHVWVEKAEQEFYFPCETKPRLVVFDKGHRVFKLMRFPKSQQELSYQLQHDEDLLGRMRAARELAAYKSDATIETLQHCLQGNDFHAVRMAVAISLGEIGSSEARTILLEGYQNSSDSHVRRACVWALGCNKKADAATVSVLSQVIEKDPSYFTSVAAVRALGHISADSSTAYDTICTALAQDSWQEVVRASVFHTFRHAKEKRAVELALKHSHYGEHAAVRVAAIGALGTLGKELHKEKADHHITDHLIGLLNDKAIRARVAAARALNKTGNKKALPPLREALNRECLDQLKAALQDAIEAIEKK